MPKTPQDIVAATGLDRLTVYHYIQKGIIDAERKGRKFFIADLEYDRVVRSYETRGFILPPRYEGSRTPQELAVELGKHVTSIQRYLKLGYISAETVPSKGRGGKRWIIDPDVYDAFVQRYREAHTHLTTWSTVGDYAAAIRLSPQWVRELIRAGRIEADKISRIEAMLKTKDEHTYRLPPHEMERAYALRQLISVGDLLTRIEIDGLHFSHGYFLYTVLPALGLENKNILTTAGVQVTDLPVILEYVKTYSQTVRRKTSPGKEDTSILNNPPPNINDPTTENHEKQLWFLAKRGNERAFEYLVRSYTPYISIKARHILGSDTQTKIAQGMLGLWQAVQHASNFRNIRSYAKRYIHGRILNFMKEERHKKNTISLETLVAEDSSLKKKLGMD